MPKLRQRPPPPDPAQAGPAEADPAGSYLTVPVSAVARSPVLWATADTPVAEAARRMAEANAGSILVRASPDTGSEAHAGGDDPGIVTDRDLRRVVSESIAPDSPLGRIASRPLLTLPADAPIAAAHLRMLEANVHHLAIVVPRGAASAGGDEGTDDHGVVGIVSSSDLHRHQSQGPFFVLQRIESVEQAGDYGALRDRAVRSLRLGGVAAERIGRIASYLDDHLVRRILRSEIAELVAASGPLPAPWVWVAFGSDGRREQPVALDQHNALVFDPSGLDLEAAARASDLYHRLAARVSGRLLDCGLPASRGGFVAERWCATLAEWRRRFLHWLEEPDAESLEHAQIFFDLRGVDGDLDAESLAGAVVEAAQRPEFLRLMAAMAERRRPAVGRWRGLSKNGEGEVDLVEGGLRPLVALARVVALAAGAPVPPTSTLDRLEIAAEAGLLPRPAADQLIETYHLLSDLILDRQLAAPGDALAAARVRPGALGKYRRKRLEKALRFLRKQQSGLAATVAKAASDAGQRTAPRSSEAGVR